MLKSYIKIAWRNLQRNKVFSFINVFGLAIGLTCCLLVSLYIWHESSYDSYHPHIDRLYQVGTTDIAHGEEQRFQGCPNTLAGLFKSVFPQVEATARICPLLSDDKTLIQYYAPGGEVRSFNEEKGFMADSGFFHLFKYNFVEGTATGAISGPYTVVLSREIAKKLFGNEPALNKVIHISSQLNGDHDYTVSGIFEPENKPTHIDGRFFLSMYGGAVGDLVRNFSNMASNYFFVTYVMLKQGANPAQIESRLPEFVNTYEGKDLRAFGFWRKHFLLKVRDIHLHANMRYGDVTPTGSVTYLYILGSIAVFTLLIACINFMNLATARSVKRAAEVGVRKTLGAGQSSLVRQFLGESLVMAFLALIVAIGLSYFLLPLFNRISGKTIWVSPQQWAILGAGLLILTFLTGLLAGSYPAFYLSSFKPVSVLKGKIVSSLSVISIRKGLVVFQFCISITLIVAAVIISNQMHYLRNADLGFTKDQQLILSLRSQNSQKLYTALKSDLEKNANIHSVGASFFYPGYMGWGGGYYGEGQDEKTAHFMFINIVDFDFLKTLQIKPVAGHLFTSQIPSDSVDGIVINEQTMHDMGFTPSTCIGKKVYSIANSKSGYRVVGVMKDFHVEDLHLAIKGVGFVVNSNPVYKYIIARINPSRMDATIASVKSAWQKLNPSEPFEYTFLDEQFQRHYDADSRLASLVGYATILAIIISCLGLFGLVAFSAEQRTKEIGIRKVLGAGIPNILVLISKDFLKLVGIAILIGCPLGWYTTHRWLQDFAYRTPLTWSIFAMSILVVTGIALLTISFQAIRAALANPVTSLRSE